MSSRKKRIKQERREIVAQSPPATCRTIWWILSGTAIVLLSALIYYWPGKVDDVTESKEPAASGDAKPLAEATSANLAATVREETVPVSSGPS